MELPIILAQRIMDVIRSSGVTKMQANSALTITSTLLASADDITFQSLRQTEQEKREIREMMEETLGPAGAPDRDAIEFHELLKEFREELRLVAGSLKQWTSRHEMHPAD